MINLTEMPHPDNLIRICEAIIVARVERDLIREEILYFELIDLIRSPEIVKLISGSYVKQRKDKL